MTWSDRPADRLRALLDDIPQVDRAPSLREDATRLLRSMRTQGERAVRGRLVTRHVYEVRWTPLGEPILCMRIEGRHAMAVAQQLAKRFSLVEDVGSAEVTRTDRGAVLDLRLREGK